MSDLIVTTQDIILSPDQPIMIDIERARNDNILHKPDDILQISLNYNPCSFYTRINYFIKKDCSYLFEFRMRWLDSDPFRRGHYMFLDKNFQKTSVGPFFSEMGGCSRVKINFKLFTEIDDEFYITFKFFKDPTRYYQCACEEYNENCATTPVKIKLI